MTFAVTSPFRCGSSQTETADQRKLRNAAVEFESMLIASMLEKLQDTFSEVGEQAADPGGASLNSMATQALAGTIARSSGFGLARFATEHLAQSSHADTEVIKEFSAPADIQIGSHR